MDSETQTRLGNVKKIIYQRQLESEKQRKEDLALILQNLDILDRARPHKELSQRQKAVAEAKLAVVREAERLQVELGSIWAAALRLEKMSKDGTLSDDLKAKVQAANIRSSTKTGACVSASAICRWHSLSASGLEALAPAEEWNHPLPDWVRPLFDLLGAMERPSLGRAVEELKTQGYRSDLKRAKQYIRMLAERIRAEKAAS